MATVVQYTTQIRSAVVQIGKQLGVNLAGADKQTRVLGTALCAVIAVLVKLLVDGGYITNQQLTNAFNAGMAEAFGDEPVTPPVDS